MLIIGWQAPLPVYSKWSTQMKGRIMETLRDRCRNLANKLQQDAILRQNNPVDTILEFVVAEQGRAAAPELKESLPLVLYFPTETDRNEFMAIMREAKPGMIARSV